MFAKKITCRKVLTAVEIETILGEKHEYKGVLSRAAFSEGLRVGIAAGKETCVRLYEKMMRESNTNGG